MTGTSEAVAVRLFGDRLPLASEFVELLVTDGVVRGLVGPREAPRIWERHLFNCAVVGELIPSGSFVIDVGSGAGLPGVVLAIARPDLTVVLVEPLARRTVFLDEVVSALGLTAQVRVVRARAEEYAVALAVAGARGGGGPSAGRASAPAGPALGDIVTARALAPLDRLAGWCLPLTAIGGRILALKGESAAEEVATHAATIGRLGGAPPVVRRCGVGLVDPPTTVVDILRLRAVVASRPSGSRAEVRRRRRS